MFANGLLDPWSGGGVLEARHPATHCPGCVTILLNPGFTSSSSLDHLRTHAILIKTACGPNLLLDPKTRGQGVGALRLQMPSDGTSVLICADVRVLNNAMVALLQQSCCLLDGPGALPGVHMTYTAQIWMPYSMCTPCAPCMLRQHLVM